MKKKVYLSPSNQTNNAYAYGNTTEAVQCGRISEFCRKALVRCGIETMVEQYETMEYRCKSSDRFGADLHVPIHTNACNRNVAGTRMFCNSIPGAGYNACKAISKYLFPLSPGTSESITVSDFYEIVYPKAPTAYVECEFHDVPEMAKWIIEHAEDIGEAIAHGICDYLGETYIAPSKAGSATPANNTAVKSESIKVGSLVSIKKGACYTTTNKIIPQWVLNQKWYIASINGTRAVLGQNEKKTNNINSPVDTKYLEVVSVAATNTVKTETKKEATCMISLPVLSNGMGGGYVKTLQILLNKYNNAKLAEDGVFGPNTETAVKAYQKNRGLEVDGVVGAKTWAQLLK